MVLNIIKTIIGFGMGASLGYVIANFTYRLSAYLKYKKLLSSQKINFKEITDYTYNKRKIFLVYLSGPKLLIIDDEIILIDVYSYKPVFKTNSRRVIKKIIKNLYNLSIRTSLNAETRSYVIDIIGDTKGKLRLFPYGLDYNFIEIYNCIGFYDLVESVNVNGDCKNISYLPDSIKRIIFEILVEEANLVKSKSN